MPSLTMVDVTNRTTPVAEKRKRWIQKAIPKSHEGKFSEKAKEAGMSTRTYADKEASAPGTLGREARLAKTLMGMHRSKSKSPIYAGRGKKD